MKPSKRRRPKKRENPWAGGLRALGLTLLTALVGVFLASALLSPLGEAPEEPIVLKDVRVQVLNGCGLQGAAQRVAGVLRLQGYDVTEVGNASSFDYETTMVLDRLGKGGRAGEVGVALGVEYVIIQRVEGSPFDATVIVGRDFRSLVDG